MSTWHYTNLWDWTVVVLFDGRVGGSSALLEPGQTLTFNSGSGQPMWILRPGDRWGPYLASGLVREIAQQGTAE